jgi:hypothetical protein
MFVYLFFIYFHIPPPTSYRFGMKADVSPEEALDTGKHAWDQVHAEAFDRDFLRKEDI